MDQAAAGERYRVGYNEFIGLMAGLSALNAIAIDVMLPAFGEIRDAFGLDATSSEVSLLVSFYIIGLGLGQLFWGPISDAKGRKVVIYGGLILYLIGAAITIAAPTLNVMFIGRLLWGLGAAGPRIASMAVVRDRYAGDQMARVLSVVMGVFLIVPAIAPTIGRLVLELGSWRYPFAFAAVVGAAIGLWATRLRETLPPERRRPLDASGLVEGAKALIASRSTAWATVALIFAFAAFLPYLGSTQLIYEEVYGRADQFPYLFGLTAGFMAVTSMINARMVDRLGARRTQMITQVTFVTLAGLYLALALATDGRPSFWAYYALTTLLVCSHVATTALLNSLAMEQVGHVAGMASALIGAVPTVIGAVLAGFVDHAISDSLTPMAFGFLLFGSLMLGATVLARRDAVPL